MRANPGALAALILLIVALGRPQSAKAFYNPSSGKWLNRDPMQEQGGVDLYGFVQNNPSTKVDRLGLEILCYYDANGVPTCRSPLEGCCAGRTYLYSTHCCREGKILAKAPVTTGVATHKWQENPQGAGKVHLWVTWKGGSADSNGDSVVLTPGSRTVATPAKAMPQPSVETPVKLSPCDYDFDKLNSCLARKANEQNGRFGGDCRVFAGRLITECKKESKGYTLNP